MTKILEKIEMGKRYKNKETGLVVNPMMVAYNESDRENPILIINTGENNKNILYIKPEDFLNQYTLVDYKSSLKCELDKVKEFFNNGEFTICNEVSEDKYNPLGEYGKDEAILYINVGIHEEAILVKVNGESYVADQLIFYGNYLTNINSFGETIEINDDIETLECKFFSKESLEAFINDYYKINTFKII